MLWHWLILGSILGLFGWTLYWAGLPMIGGVIGASMGGSLGFILSGLLTAPWAMAMFTGVGIVLGALGGVLLVRALQIYFFFMTGAVLGGTMGYQLVSAGLFGLAPGSGLAWLAVAVSALIGGLVLVWGRRFIVAFVTSMIGALLTSLAFPIDWQNVAMIIALVLYLAIQIGLVHRYVRQEDFDERTRRRLRNTAYPDVDTAH